MNGAGRIGAGGEGGRPRPERMHVARAIGCYGTVMAGLPRPRRERRVSRRSMSVSALLLCAVALLIVSSFALAPLSKGDAASDNGTTLVRQPPPPKNVQGFVYYSDGVTPVVLCEVNVTNTRTGDWNLTVTDDTYGWYEFNMNDFLNGVLEGDIINVTATKDLDIGWNEGVVGPGFLDMNVLMSGTVIPEFPMVTIPVVGLMALFAVVGLRRRKASAQ